MMFYFISLPLTMGWWRRRPSDLHRAFEMRFDDLMSPVIAINLDRYNSVDERSRLIAGLHLSGF